MKYQPDIIISVHPLMQHVPLRILRSKGLLKKIIFTTVVTDLSTCHPTWYILQLFNHSVILILVLILPCNFIFRFHKLVTRCYCPSEEVAKRALKAGLNSSQIKVYGLPVRPSFVKPVPPKVGVIPLLPLAQGAWKQAALQSYLCILCIVFFLCFIEHYAQVFICIKNN